MPIDESEWIIESSPDGKNGRLAHVSEPWFACSFATDAAGAGEFHGLTVETGEWVLCNFTWRDGLPHENVLRDLCAEAMTLLSNRL